MSTPKPRKARTVRRRWMNIYAETESSLMNNKATALMSISPFMTYLGTVRVTISLPLRGDKKK